MDSQGDVYVTDWGDNRVQIYDPGGDILTALYGDATEFSKWAKEMVETNPDVVKAYRRVKDKSLLARFDGARGIAIDDQDRIIITESPTAISQGSRCTLKSRVTWSPSSTCE